MWTKHYLIKKVFSKRGLEGKRITLFVNRSLYEMVELMRCEQSHLSLRIVIPTKSLMRILMGTALKGRKQL